VVAGALDSIDGRTPEGWAVLLEEVDHTCHRIKVIVV
jgi:hypothetical protein